MRISPESSAPAMLPTVLAARSLPCSGPAEPGAAPAGASEAAIRGAGVASSVSGTKNNVVPLTLLATQRQRHEEQRRRRDQRAQSQRQRRRTGSHPWRGEDRYTEGGACGAQREIQGGQAAALSRPATAERIAGRQRRQGDADLRGPDVV